MQLEQIETGETASFQNADDEAQKTAATEHEQSTLFDNKDKDEKRHRAQAVAKHRRRFLTQLLAVVTYTSLLMFAPIYWQSMINAGGYKFGPDWPMSIIEIWISSMLRQESASIPSLDFLIILFIPPFIVITMTAFLHLRYRFLRDQEWELRAAEAESNEPRTAAKGYMGVFRLYARTKRRAVFTLFGAIVWIVWAAVGYLMLSVADGEPVNFYVPWAIRSAQLVTVTSAVLMGFVAFDISRRYVPGKILVLKIMIMAYRAATSQTNYNEARLEAEKLQEEEIERKPWWFYSYRKPQKSSS